MPLQRYSGQQLPHDAKEADATVVIAVTFISFVVACGGLQRDSFLLFWTYGLLNTIINPLDVACISCSVTVSESISEANSGLHICWRSAELCCERLGGPAVAVTGTGFVCCQGSPLLSSDWCHLPEVGLKPVRAWKRFLKRTCKFFHFTLFTDFAGVNASPSPDRVSFFEILLCCTPSHNQHSDNCV